MPNSPQMNMCSLEKWIYLVYSWIYLMRAIPSDTSYPIKINIYEALEHMTLPSFRKTTKQGKLAVLKD